MKNFKALFVVALVALTLTGCTEQPFNKGLYAISVVLAAGAVYCVYAVFAGYNSKTTRQTPYGIKEESSGVIPWAYVFGFALLMFGAIGSAKWIYEDNRKWDAKKDDPYPEKPAPDGRESAEDLARKADSTYNLKK